MRQRKTLLLHPLKSGWRYSTSAHQHFEESRTFTLWFLTGNLETNPTWSLP